ncbi:hypothetical protein WM24_27450 [Burkholderia ubonensis]|nr:hypothetical protein WM24_27450 [Burkholderia ubonensis]
MHDRPASLEQKFDQANLILLDRRGEDVVDREPKSGSARRAALILFRRPAVPNVEAVTENERDACVANGGELWVQFANERFSFLQFCQAVLADRLGMVNEGFVGRRFELHGVLRILFGRVFRAGENPCLNSVALRSNKCYSL